MTRPRARTRILDLIVTLVAIGLCMAPFIPAVLAGSTRDQPLSVEQEVRRALGITQPDPGEFDLDPSGVSNGSIFWDAWASGDGGFKLTVSTPRTPAMADASRGVSVADYGALSKWSVGAGQSRFGFTAVGSQAMAVYKGGSRWRGFQGTYPIEVARKRGKAIASTRTEVKLRAELGSALPAGSAPEALIVGTVTENL